MAAVITRSNHPDLLWPGVKEIFGLTYDEYPDEYSMVFEQTTGEKAYEKLVEATGFGLAPVKSEGAAVQYDTDGEGYVTVATPTVYSLGYQVTREELEDSLYLEVSSRRASSLAFSMKTTIEQVHANMFLNGFSSNYLFGDGQPMFSDAHPTRNGTQSNEAAVAADFSEASLEDMIKQISLAKNSRGLLIKLMPEQLIVAADDMFNATRVLESTLRTSTANNDINASRAMGVLPKGAMIWHYLGVQATGSWFIKNRMPRGAGLQSIWRRKPTLEKDNDFDTDNAKAKTSARFVPTIADWRAVYANQGV